MHQSFVSRASAKPLHWSQVRQQVAWDKRGGAACPTAAHCDDSSRVHGTNARPNAQEDVAQALPARTSVASRQRGWPKGLQSQPNMKTRGDHSPRHIQKSHDDVAVALCWHPSRSTGPTTQSIRRCQAPCCTREALERCQAPPAPSAPSCQASLRVTSQLLPWRSCC